MVAIAPALVHVVADVLSSAAQWALEMDLAAPSRQSEYQGVANLLAGAARGLAPQLVAILLIAHDPWG
ncbi:hypothetical protein EV651_11250 [Kribbella sp. VKM Ac-2571]|uniref:hypothetical protein n=1 Tax=Kribbella sp. VKM Ac-2571 TaxID=2512222 RepID=UPI00105D9D14|nr:hypothetical protein [Kribbella sp. VKM Ac-2571]TDO56663.1 hypothetical protein EV651_11250 [Kribbella sp. VKM Ac-2571]